MDAKLCVFDGFILMRLQIDSIANFRACGQEQLLQPMPQTHRQQAQLLPFTLECFNLISGSSMGDLMSH